MKDKISINRIFLCVAFGVFLAIIGDYTDAPLKGWYILSVFISIILSFILKAAPMSISVLSGLFCLDFFFVGLFLVMIFRLLIKKSVQSEFERLHVPSKTLFSFVFCRQLSPCHHRER